MKIFGVKYELAGDEGRKFSEVIDNLGHFLYCVIDFFFRVIPAQAESYGAVRGGKRYPHGAKDM